MATGSWDFDCVWFYCSDVFYLLIDALSITFNRKAGKKWLNKYMQSHSGNAFFGGVLSMHTYFSNTEGWKDPQSCAKLQTCSTNCTN